MANRATAETVAADMRPPNFREAVKRLRGIKAKKEKIGSVNGEIADIYAKAEGLKVNKKAARMFLTLDPLEAPERTDIIRSLMGLIDVAEWDAGDLVDQAEGSDNIVTPDFGGRRALAEGENDAGEDEDVDAAMREIENMPREDDDVVEEKPKRAGAAVRAAEARDRVRKHFGEGTKPPTGTPSEPYTGDNSDLNPA